MGGRGGNGVNRIEVRRAVDGKYIIAVGNHALTVSEKEAFELAAKVATVGRQSDDGAARRA